MPNFLIGVNYYQGTADPLTPVIGPDRIEARAVFSINASNMLQGTFWLVKNGEIVLNDLGQAQYRVFDKDGDAIGIQENSIVANGDGQFIITAVNAILIQDLTHYVVEVAISYQNALRKNYVGITLGE